MPATLNASPIPAVGRQSAPIGHEQIEFFVDQGYLVVPGLVGEAELAELSSDLVALARGRYECSELPPVPDDLDERSILENILCIHQPHYVSPVIRRYVAHAGIAAVLSKITAAHLPHWDGAVKCMQSMYFAKAPGKPGQAWHQDEMYIPTRDRSLIGAWIAIDDATIENGCLWVMPGSHRNGYIYPNRPPEDLEEYDGSSQCFGFDEEQAVPVEVPRGSVVFFNGYLLHKSLRNRSASSFRRVLVNHYMNAWSFLPWQQTKDGQSIAQADSRNILMISGKDPYEWKPTELPPKAVYLRNWGKKK
jgi:phytanoyl-CoA hydroxylase